MLKERFARWLSHARSYRVGLAASRRCGRAIKLRRVGRLREALETARSGLALLDGPTVQRQQAVEGSVLVTLAVEAEWLGQQLGEPGASTKDVADAAEFLRSMAATTKGPAEEMRRKWLPYLEARLARVTGNTSGAVEP